MQKLALFDLDNTLIDRTGGFRRWAERFTVDRGLDEGAVDWMMAADRDGYASRPGFFAALRERFDLSETAEELFTDYQRQLPGLVSCSAQVLAGLAGLRSAGWRIGIVTNGLHATQYTKIRDSGLSACVDGWCVSESEGVNKPELEIFARAAGRCGSPLRDGGWMIGDSPVHDIHGGAAAGLDTVWVRRGREWTHGAPRPTHTVDDILDAFNHLHHAHPAGVK